MPENCKPRTTYSYSFSKHDIKFGGDVDTFTDRKDTFVGWSSGEYEFNTLCDFDPVPNAPWCSSADPNYSGTTPACAQPVFLHSRAGFKMRPQIEPGNSNSPFSSKRIRFSTTIRPVRVSIGRIRSGRSTPRITLTYGLRWDGTWNPQPQSAIPGETRFGSEKVFPACRWPRPSASRTISSNGARASALGMEYRKLLLTPNRASRRMGLLLRTNASYFLPHDWNLEANNCFLPIGIFSILRATWRNPQFG